VIASNASTRGFWPNKEQELMLRACLLRDNEALIAWQAWRSRVDIDTLDPGSNRLLPLLYHNLSQLEVEDPLMNRMKRIYRYYWAQNQLLFHHAAVILDILQKNGIETMLLKGGALVLLHYGDHGLRPMGDIDILIHPDKAKLAIDLLLEANWQMKAEWMTVEKTLKRSSAGAFVNDHGCEIDLHWNVFPQGRQPHADDYFWSESVETKLAGVPTRCENSTELLFHVCVHGAQWSAVSPIRWIADAMIIINSVTQEINWEHLVKQAFKRRLTLPLWKTLDYLKNNFYAPIPSTHLEELEKMHHPFIERLEYSFKYKPVGMLGAFPGHCFNYFRLVEESSIIQKFWGLPVYFQGLWGLNKSWKIPFFIVSKLWERLKIRFAR
jgi:hypothetical protein